jgi:hypothetical protein
MLPPGANVIKLKITAIPPSFCVIKQYYDGNYHRMTVSNTMVIYHGNLPWYFNTINNRYCLTLAVNYCSI